MELFSKKQADVLKGAAALMVVTAHYSQWLMSAGNVNLFIWLFSKLGRYGVAIFMLISGYGLTMKLENNADGKYIINKIGKIYSSYFIIHYIYKFIICRTPFSTEEILKFFLGREEWFIPVIILFYILLYAAMKYFKRSFLLVVLGG